MSWQPSCDIEILKARAELYAQIRAFFMSRDVVEVETPLLSHATATDPFLASIPATVQTAAPTSKTFYLHTSPEFPMKRLLAAGSGSIYQICKTFRDGESGKRHNPEFTMLEWYRPGFDLDMLMDEVAALIKKTLGESTVTKLSYREAFLQYLDFDPFEISLMDLIQRAKDLCHFDDDGLKRDDYLNLLLATQIEPNLGQSQPQFLYQYPASQASLAKTKTQENHKVAERFELYIGGLEIANGYNELTDPIEQRARFQDDNREREALGLPTIPLDEQLLAALEAGLPECSGVALGLDRLLMIQQNAEHIDDVISFPIERA